MLFDLTLVPLPLLAAVTFGFGVIIGSFLNVYIYRFHTGKSLSGHSHCLSCGTRLRWYELLPLVSYLGLRGRCRSCGSHIPARYFLVELATGLLFALSLTLSLDLITILLWWYILAVLMVITVYDLYHFIIPDRLTAYLLAAALVLVGYEYWLAPVSLDSLLWRFGAALMGAGFFYLLWWMSKGQWLGFGDVKLAIPLGFLVGAGTVFSFVVLSFWIGAAISLVILGWQHLNRGKASLPLPPKALTMKSAVPFAPFLVLSCLTCLFTQFNVLTLFSFI